MPFAPMSPSFRPRRWPSGSTRFAGGFATIAMSAALLGMGSTATAADTIWQSGTTQGLWSNAANWSNGVPNSTTNTYTGSDGADIVLGAGAQAQTFFVEGPLSGTSTLSAGDLTLSEQLFINITSGSAEATTVPLRLYDAGSAPVSLTAPNAYLGYDAGKQGGVILDSRPGGSATFNVTNTLSIGNDGDGNFVYTLPLPGTPAGAAAITAGTILVSVGTNSGHEDYNYIGTYNAGHSVNATNLVLGVAGYKGGAENYGGDWTVVNTALADQASAAGNYLTITDGGTFTNTGAFTVGVRGVDNTVYVGYADSSLSTNATNGTLRLTGPNDLVIGLESTAAYNEIRVDHASTLSANGNIVVGVDGQHGELLINDGSTVTSGGARLGVNAGAESNAIFVTGSSSLTMNGSVRVGDKGSYNALNILAGGTVTLTGTDKNFYIGYDKGAQMNVVVVAGTNSTLSVKAAGADLVVSGNVTGTGSTGPLNVLFAADGGVVDTNRTLVGDGGQIWGVDGTIKGDTFVGAGGAIAPGIYLSVPGSLSFTDNVDLSNGGTFYAIAGPGTSSFIDVGGTLTLGGTSALVINGTAADPGTAYIIAHYGSLAGHFGSISGLPAGATIDYNYFGLNEIAVITAVPEIAAASAGTAFILLACSFALLERRGGRRPDTEPEGAS